MSVAILITGSLNEIDQVVAAYTCTRGVQPLMQGNPLLVAAPVPRPSKTIESAMERIDYLVAGARD